MGIFQHENLMKAALLALVMTWAALLAQTVAMAQSAPAQRNKVSVIYVPPKNPAHQPIYEQLKEIGFLEKVREFLSPVQLPRTLLLKLEGADTQVYALAGPLFDTILFAGAAYAYKTEAEAAKTPPGIKQFADAHGTPAQRLYNLLCLAYGADPQLFGDFVENGYLPKE